MVDLSRIEIGPQPGPQTDFLSSEADIAIYGGAAGGGKSYGLLLDPLRYVNVPGFGFVIFRRESPQITNQGGLWDTSLEIYPIVGATQRQYNLSWQFAPGIKGRFSHLQHDNDVLKWQGSQIPYIGFDELTHFTENQFFYMVSRNRSVCGVKPCIRGTTNPMPGWVKVFLAPWLDKQYPNPAESGEIRHFVRVDGVITWVAADYVDDEGTPAKSVTFIRSTIYDNQILLKADPGYLTNLKSLSLIDQARLLHGDWDVFEGAFFNEWSESAHIPTVTPYTHDDPPPSYWTYFGGIDWGYADPFAVVLLGLDEFGTTHVLESFQKAGLTNEEMAAKVCEILYSWGIPKNKCMFAYDPGMNSRPSVNAVKGVAPIEAFHGSGLWCVAADTHSKDAVKNGWSRVRTYLHVKNSFKVWRGTNADLIRIFPLAQFDKLQVEHMLHDYCSHLMAALRYSLMTRPDAVEVPDRELSVNEAYEKANAAFEAENLRRRNERLGVVKSHDDEWVTAPAATLRPIGY